MTLFSLYVGLILKETFREKDRSLGHYLKNENYLKTGK